MSLRVPLILCLLVLLACAGPKENPNTGNNTNLRLVLTSDQTAVDLFIESSVTLSALQFFVTFDPDKIDLGTATPGPNGTMDVLFDDAKRNPGRLLVGLSDLNRNAIPKNGSIVRIPVQIASSGVILGIEDIVAVDLFGEKVSTNAEELTIP